MLLIELRLLLQLFFKLQYNLEKISIKFALLVLLYEILLINVVNAVFVYVVLTDMHFI